MTWPLLVCFLLICFHAPPVAAQIQARFYYAIENLDSGQVVRRDVASSNGIPRGGLILAPTTNYRQWLFQADNGFTGYTEFTTPTAGSTLSMPATPLRPPVTLDSDGDGLSDDAEFVLGTDPLSSDTDGDGISDGAAVQLGLDPGAGARTGVIASVDTPGNAVDVCAFNDLAIVADSGRGISVFNVFNRMSPLIIAQVDTPGVATAVACSGTLVAVADGEAGLSVVDIADPPTARIIHQVDVGGNAQAVAAAGGLGFVGTIEGALSVVDLTSGVVLLRLNLSRIEDLAMEGETLFAFAGSQLLVLTNAFGTLGIAGSTFSPGAQQAFNGRGRIAVGGGLAFLARSDGYNRFSVTNVSSPELLNSVTANQAGWKQVVPTGTGLGVVAAGINSFDDGSHHVALYDLVNTGVNAGFLTQFQTPGIARAVALYNGLAYVADSDSGLEVVGYTAPDGGTSSPSISIVPTFGLTTPTNGVVEEGKLVRVAAIAGDDAQVRNVEFYLDGIKAATDGNFPYEFQFVAPRRAGRTSFSLQARASDTGGRFTFTPSIEVALLPDVTPPQVIGNPLVVTNVSSWFTHFDELLDPATASPTNLSIVYAGPDNRIGTSDDSIVTNVTFSYRESIRAVVATFAGAVPYGQYALLPGAALRDRAGNEVTNFTMRTLWVLASGPDGDDDGDSLSNADEAARGTNPTLADTDGDRWADNLEVEDETDPLNSRSRPDAIFGSRTLVDLLLPIAGGLNGSVVAVARPPVEILSPIAGGTASGGVVVARPPVEVVLPIGGGSGNGAITIARPPVVIERQP